VRGQVDEINLTDADGGERRGGSGHGSQFLLLRSCHIFCAWVLNHTKVATPNPIPRNNGNGDVQIIAMKKKYATNRRNARMRVATIMGVL